MDHQPPPPLVQTEAVPPPPQPAWNGKTNGLACIALLMSLFGCGLPLAVIFGVIGLRQATRNGDKRGRRYAIAALCISGLWLVVLVVAFAVSLADGPDRDDTGAVRGNRSIALTKLRTGDCIEGLSTQTGNYVDVVPCAGPHDTEVVGRYDLPKGDWPGDAPVKESTQTGCDERFEAYSGLKVDDPSYSSLAVPPEELDWPGDRGVLCLAYHVGATTGSVRR